MNLIKILTAENQKNSGIYKLIDNFFEILNDKYWLIKYVNWELKFYKQIGYDINFNDYVNESLEDNKISYRLKNSNKRIPKFLINKNDVDVSFEEINMALKIVGNFLNKTIIKPNNLNFPKTRFIFQNSLK